MITHRCGRALVKDSPTPLFLLSLIWYITEQRQRKVVTLQKHLDGSKPVAERFSFGEPLFLTIRQAVTHLPALSEIGKGVS